MSGDYGDGMVASGAPWRKRRSKEGDAMVARASEERGGAET